MDSERAIFWYIFNYLITFHRFCLLIKNVYQLLGSFNLTELEGVDIRNRDMMKAVVFLCPRLQTIEFNSSSPGPLKEEDVITTDELSSVLNEQQSVWPEVFIQDYQKSYYLLILILCNHRFRW